MTLSSIIARFVKMPKTRKRSRAVANSRCKGKVCELATVVLCMGCRYCQNSALSIFLNGAFIFLNGAFIFVNGAFIFVNGAFIFVIGAFIFVNGAFIFVNGALFIQRSGDNIR